MTRRAPLIVVLGATACGKSRLAIELAQRFCGEIISADSMQVYKGLDIVTNKVTEDEQQQAQHHMINFIDPMSRYSVIDFRNKSLDIISNLHSQKKLPIVVGGTNYYIESLLWKAFTLEPTFKQPPKRDYEEDALEIGDKLRDQNETLIDSEAKYLDSVPGTIRHTEDDLEDVDKFFSKRIYNDGFAHIDSEKLWNILEQVDRNMAHLYHPHDKRRIIRILQVIQENKGTKSYSDILKEVNKSSTNEESLGGPLRFNATCVIWLQCDNGVLDKIMDDRVDSMLSKGLLAELESFHDEYNKRRLSEGKWPDYDKGIFQTIGFKEFHDYLKLDVETKTSDDGKEILKRSIERMKLSTRRYARRQLKWIRRRFLQKGTRELPPLFKLTTAFDETGWQKQVHQPAMSIVEQFIKGDNIDENLLAYKQEPEEQGVANKPGKLHCEVCDRVLIGTHYIDVHLKSRNHRSNLNKRNQSVKRQRTSENTSNATGDATIEPESPGERSVSVESH